MSDLLGPDAGAVLGLQIPKSCKTYFFSKSSNDAPHPIVPLLFSYVLGARCQSQLTPPPVRDAGRRSRARGRLLPRLSGAEAWSGQDRPPATARQPPQNRLYRL